MEVSAHSFSGAAGTFASAKTGGCWWVRVGVGPCYECHTPSAGIVVSSTASPSEGTSSDSCLTSTGDSLVGLSGRLAAQGLVGTCSPFSLTSPLLETQSATPVLQAQQALGGATLLPVTFQEGRRASDTSLTQGDCPSRSLPPAPGHAGWALEGFLSLVANGIPPFTSGHGQSSAPQAG